MTTSASSPINTDVEPTPKNIAHIKGNGVWIMDTSEKNFRYKDAIKAAKDAKKNNSPMPPKT